MSQAFNQEHPFKARKAHGHIVCLSKNSLLLLSHPNFVPLISHPGLLSHFQPLSVSSCHWGKQNAVAVETIGSEAAHATSSVQTEAYKWQFPVWVLRDGYKPLWTMCLFSVRNSDRRWGEESYWPTNKDVLSLIRWSLNLAAAVMTVRTSSFLGQHNTDYSQFCICALLLWLWLTALKRQTMTHLLQHGCSQLLHLCTAVEIYSGLNTGKASLSTVEFGIVSAVARLDGQVKCDAGRVLRTTVWIWKWNSSFLCVTNPFSSLWV